MSRYVDDLRVPTCVFEAAAWQETVKITCPHGHSVVHDAHGLWWWCYRRRVSDNFLDLCRTLACSQCKDAGKGLVRPASVARSREKPTAELPLPPEREWKRALRRIRS